MMKKCIALLLCILIALPMAVFADNEHPTSIEAPTGVNVLQTDHPSILDLRIIHPASLIKAMEEHWFYYEVDWKINEGPWHFNINRTGTLSESMHEYYEEREGIYAYVNNIIHDDENGITIFILASTLGKEEYDLTNDTYTFRVRYVYEDSDEDPATDGWLYKYVTSPWVESSIGKKGTSALPTSLEAPFDLKAELRRQENGQPYFHLSWKAPESVKEVNNLIHVMHWIDWKVGDGKWASERGELEYSSTYFSYSIDIDPEVHFKDGGTKIEENVYSFRKLFEFTKPNGQKVRSGYSNIATIGTPVFYEAASEWAKPELQQASEAGLIPAILKGKDMTKPITREEFAELAVLLYEQTTGKEAVPASSNPFNDTTNPQILKAYALEITRGTSDTTFSPSVLINREQCATMLFRTIKAIAPNGDYSIDGVSDFPDQQHISSWAVDGTKYMSKMGIIRGDNAGNFMPKAVTSAQEAANYGMATREAAVLMTIRTFNIMK